MLCQCKAYPDWCLLLLRLSESNSQLAEPLKKVSVENNTAANQRDGGAQSSSAPSPLGRTTEERMNSSLCSPDLQPHSWGGGASDEPQSCLWDPTTCCSTVATCSWCLHSNMTHSSSGPNSSVSSLAPSRWMWGHPGEVTGVTAALDRKTRTIQMEARAPGGSPGRLRETMQHWT